MTTDISEPRLTLTSPADILAAVPYLVGFHPHDSLIVIGIDDAEVKVTARWDLPVPPGALSPLPQLMARERVTRLVAVGYGPGERVTPAIDQLRALTPTTLCEALRADQGRYWSYLCDLPHCCPPEGTPYDPVSSPIATEAIVSGLVALPDRATVEATVAPLSGPVRLAVRKATADAVAELRAKLSASSDADAFARDFVSRGLIRVRAAIATAQAGGRIDDRQAARLGLDLAVIRVRDEAWTLLDDATQPAHLHLWKDLTRRLEPRFVPPAASLLAMAAWRSGTGALASIALDRALSLDPAYSMAGLLRHAMQHLLAPQSLTERMPSPADLDHAMGPPRAIWLTPLLNILDEPAAA